MNKIQLLAIKSEACRIGVEPEALASFVEVESGGKGFNPDGKLIIQFEPVWFKRKAPYAPSGLWSLNKVDVQSKEWQAFNDAYRLDANAAMESTSIGLGQVMGFHYKRLGYRTVGDMWNDAKKGEDRQIFQMAEFIRTDNRLISALKNKNWHLVATYYNGSGYMNIAKKYGREPYNISMEKAYKKHKAK
ncbi:MAG: N-acetylmuramidase family protein [Dysgonamonadaceae bacterium]|nr:N-acetylmuramidase family protein [Dysgonamonadaceae bacterium]